MAAPKTTGRVQAERIELPEVFANLGDEQNAATFFQSESGISAQGEHRVHRVFPPNGTALVT